MRKVNVSVKIPPKRLNLNTIYKHILVLNHFWMLSKDENRCFTISYIYISIENRN